jgi:ComF family protein
MAIRAADWFLNLLYPPKCVLCSRVLQQSETDFCRKCRVSAPEYAGADRTGAFFDQCVSAYFYQDAVRESLIRYKFMGMQQSAGAYGRTLAMPLTRRKLDDFDLVTWVPVSRKREKQRGYDQAKLLAAAVAEELRLPLVQILRKNSDNPPQSRQRDASARKANVLGRYETTDKKQIDKQCILLIDDVITTGATLAECSRMLKTAGAATIVCGTFAATAILDRKQVEQP